MSEKTENTLSAYLGHEFQMNLMWQVLVEPDFGDRVVKDLAVDYFDDPILKKMFIIINEYYKEYNRVPNLQNQTVQIAINKFKTPNNIIEQESLFAIVDKIKLWNERVLNQQIAYSGEVIQKETINFIKQQEYRKLGEFILDKTKSGEIKGKNMLGILDEKINRISNIGDEEDYGIEIGFDIKRALSKEFRETIPTGIAVLDGVTGGGLGKGEIGLILTPSGVGKTTTLSKIANTAYDDGKKVLQIIFEDTEDQIRRKHFTIWSKVPLSQIDDNLDFVEKSASDKIKEIEGRGGKLIIKKFSQENTTIQDIKNWIIKFQKLFGYKFDILILDYLDCLESNKKGIDRQEAELAIVKSFLALAADFDIPCWSALQSNRTGFDSEFLEVNQIGGNVKRYQKAHFFMSIAKPVDQKDSNLVNIKILKARFIKDGQQFKDSILDNDTMNINFNDSDYNGKYGSKSFKKTSEEVLDKMKNNLAHVAASSVFDYGDDETVKTYSKTLSGNIPPQDDEPILNHSVNEKSLGEIESTLLDSDSIDMMMYRNKGGIL